MTARAIPQGGFGSVPIHSDGPPYLSIAHHGAGPDGCRVCEMGVHPGERTWMRAYAPGFAHVSCGWFREDEKHSVPGNLFELTCCTACGDPMYVRHCRPGPWPPPRATRCFNCRLGAS